MDPSRTNLVFTDRHVTGERVRLIPHQNSDDSWALEAYKINPSGLEEFVSFVNRHSIPELTRQVVSHVAAEIRRKPISIASLHWLACLHYVGLLDIYESS